MAPSWRSLGMARSANGGKLDLLTDGQRTALYARVLPRRTQLPNRIDPFDLTLCTKRLQAAAAQCCAALGNSFCRCAPASTVPARQLVYVAERRIAVLEAHGTYAMRLWHSSIVLASWLDANAAAFDGQTVLEVGCGTGLCSLALAAASSARVMASDHDEAGLALLRQSAQEQALQLQTCTFDVCGPAPLPPADWLVASDVAYTPQLADALARRCIEILGRGGRAVVADPGRPGRGLFQAVLESHGLAASFRDPAQVVAGGDARLMLLHVAGEHSVSVFPAHAELAA